MTKYRMVRGVLAGLVGVALLAGGLATASNMGFKFVPSVAANQYFNLALPWNNNYTKASQLLNDLPNIVRVSKYTSTGLLKDWFAGAPLANNFAVASGEAYIVKAGTSASNTAVVVGSHNPNFTFTFPANQYFNAAAPYHQTFTKASQLLNDISTHLGATAVARVSKYTSTGLLQDWFSGAPLSNNFNLDLGMGVIIKGGSTGGSGYVWPHY
jgi:hypothetical protein